MIATRPDPAPLEPAERLAIAYAPAAHRGACEAALMLDAVLRRIAAGRREPLLTQIKLAWWRERCAAPGAHSAHPVLAVLAAAWRGEVERLVALVDAWEAVAVAQAWGGDMVDALAKARVEALASALQFKPDAASDAGRAWSAVDLARIAPDTAMREAWLARARQTPAQRLPRALRPVMVLDGLARRTAARGSADLFGDRLSPLAAIRLGILGR